MRSFVGLMTALMALLAQSAGAQTQQPPPALVVVGDCGEGIYDLAKAKDWAKVGEKWTALDGAAKKLPGELKGAAPEQKRLGTTLKDLEKAIGAKDERGTKLAANQVTLIAADMIEPFNPEVPAAVTRLDFYGRELEIYGADKNTAMLKTTGDAMRKVWDKLQPSVKSKGGDAEAKRFSDLMTQVAAAKTVEDYARVTTPILDEVDNLEKVFKKK